MIRVLLNGVEVVNQPDGIDKLNEKFSLASIMPVFYTEITGELTFYNDEFNYLFDEFKENPCGIITAEIQQKRGDTSNWQRRFIGNIFIGDSEFNFDQRTVSCRYDALYIFEFSYRVLVFKVFIWLKLKYCLP